MDNSRVVLKGSERKAIPQAESLLTTPAPGRLKAPGSGLHPDEQVEVTINLRRKQEIPHETIISGGLDQKAMERDHGIADSDLILVTSFLREYNLRLVEVHPGSSSLKTAGKLSDLEKAFGTHMENVLVSDKVFRQRLGAITIPANLDTIITGVFGLDNRPQAMPRFRLMPHNALAFSPLDVAKLYDFPSGDGSGQTIAIIELGGGFSPADLSTYFTSLGINNPSVVAIPVSGGTNAPTGISGGPDGEVMLDIEVAGAIAPKANIRVYFAPNTDKGFIDAINAAVHDTISPTVVSISWGGPEETWTEQTLMAIESAFQTAASMGIPVTVASGDQGSTDGTSSLTVDFPASAPHALACGGTHLEGQTSITNEVVWNRNGGASGGGVSNFFSKPSYQDSIKVPSPSQPGGGRGVPDIAGDAAPETGYRVRVDGIDTVVGGTSAVAPLWAGLIALMAQNLASKIPFLNPILYNNPQVMNDILIGNNDTGGGDGNYQAGPGWDPCTGLGSPNGMKILNMVKSSLGIENQALASNNQGLPNQPSNTTQPGNQPAVAGLNTREDVLKEISNQIAQVSSKAIDALNEIMKSLNKI